VIELAVIAARLNMGSAEVNREVVFRCLVVLIVINSVVVQSFSSNLLSSTSKTGIISAIEPKLSLLPCPLSRFVAVLSGPRTLIYLVITA
jgi:hypothetical protein